MNVKILAFGIAKDIFGTSVLDCKLEEGTTAAGLKAVLEAQFPRLAQLSSYMIAINNEYALPATGISATDEIAIIPPVSGG